MDGAAAPVGLAADAPPAACWYDTKAHAGGVPLGGRGDLARIGFCVEKALLAAVASRAAEAAADAAARRSM